MKKEVSKDNVMDNTIDFLKKKIEKATLIDLKECAKILGLKYHTARKYLLEDATFGYVVFGNKKLWLLDDILEYKYNHYVPVNIA